MTQDAQSISLEAKLQAKRDAILQLATRYGARNVRIFGSVARHEADTQSDIDFLVQFSEKLDVLDYADNYFAFLEKLEVLLGKKVDLVSKKSLKNPVLIEEIDRTKIDLYAA